MSEQELFEAVCDLKQVDVQVVLRNELKSGGFRVEASLTQFQDGGDGPAKVVKKVNAYHEALSLDDAQYGALSRAAKLLGLGG